MADVLKPVPLPATSIWVLVVAAWTTDGLWSINTGTIEASRASTTNTDQKCLILPIFFFIIFSTAFP